MRRMSDPPAPSGVRLVINPRAGRGRGRRCARRLRRRLEAAGLAVRASFSRAPGDVEAQVRAACARGWQRVVVAGGDGTLHEAVNGILGSGATAALGLVPLGTGNDFAKSLGLPRDWRGAADRVVERLRAGTVRRVDAGRCNGFYFANGVGLGLDAEVAALSGRFKWLPGGAAYVAAVVGLLARGAPSAEARVEYEGGRLTQRISLAAALNGQCIGGVFRLAPTARNDDGLLQVVIAAPLNRRQIVRYAPRVMRGRHEGLAVARMFAARRLCLALDRPLVLEADGEIRDRAATRLEVEALPGALALLA